MRRASTASSNAATAKSQTLFELALQEISFRNRRLFHLRQVLTGLAFLFFVTNGTGLVVERIVCLASSSATPHDVPPVGISASGEAIPVVPGGIAGSSADPPGISSGSSDDTTGGIGEEKTISSVIDVDDTFVAEQAVNSESKVVESDAAVGRSTSSVAACDVVLLDVFSLKLQLLCGVFLLCLRVFGRSLLLHHRSADGLIDAVNKDVLEPALFVSYDLYSGKVLQLSKPK